MQVAQDGSSIDIDALADDIALLAAHIDAATQQLLSRIREFDLAGGWHEQGAVSCAQWLSWRIGMGMGAAREKLRVAHRLTELPLIDTAFAAGELSYSKVRAMTRVATPDNEELLLTMARQTTAAQLERICRLHRKAVGLNGSAETIESDQRYVRARETDDGMVSIQLRLLPEEAASFLAGAEACAESGNLADGAVHMAEAALLGASAESAQPAGPHRPPVETVVHLSAETLTGETGEGDRLEPDTCRRLLCDSGIVPMLEDGHGATIDVGRKTRTIPPALRRALDARDRGCRFAGCDNHRFVDAHHIDHWIEGGSTALSNLVILCRRHHRFVHEWGYAIESSDDGLLFRDPAGTIVAAAPPRPRLLSSHQPLGDPSITSHSNGPGWDGWPIDYAMCADSLVQTGAAPSRQSGR